MEKGKFFININVWKQTPKSRRRYRTLEEHDGVTRKKLDLWYGAIDKWI